MSEEPRKPASNSADEERWKTIRKILNAVIPKIPPTVQGYLGVLVVVVILVGIVVSIEPSRLFTTGVVILSLLILISIVFGRTVEQQPSAQNENQTLQNANRPSPHPFLAKVIPGMVVIAMGISLLGLLKDDILAIGRLYRAIFGESREHRNKSDTKDFARIKGQFEGLSVPLLSNVVSGIYLSHHFPDYSEATNLYDGQVKYEVDKILIKGYREDFVGRLNDWAYHHNKMFVEEAITSLTNKWTILTNQSAPNLPEISKVIEEGTNIIRGALSRAEADFQKWTETNSPAK